MPLLDQMAEALALAGKWRAAMEVKTMGKELGVPGWSALPISRVEVSQMSTGRALIQEVRAGWRLDSYMRSAGRQLRAERHTPQSRLYSPLGVSDFEYPADT